MANKRKLPYVPVEYQPPEQEEQVDDEQKEQVEQDPQEQLVEDEEHEQVEDEKYEDDISEDYQDFLDHEDFEREEWEKKINDQKEDEDTIIQDDELLEKLLDPLAKDQLVTLLKDFVTKYPDLITTLYSQANSDPALRKIFVHGFGWDTTTDTLKTLFSEFGEIEDCKLVTDELSGKSKGYAFIVYKSSIGAKKALKVPYKIISNRTASWQLQCEGPVPVPVPHPSAPAVVAAPPVSEYTHAQYSSSTYNEYNKHRPPHAPGVYMECLKNHTAAMGGNAVDVCGEFMPPSLSTPSLLCAACGCHRNFHHLSPRAAPSPTYYLTSPS